MLYSPRDIDILQECKSRYGYRWNRVYLFIIVIQLYYMFIISSQNNQNISTYIGAQDGNYYAYLFTITASIVPICCKIMYDVAESMYHSYNKTVDLSAKNKVYKVSLSQHLLRSLTLLTSFTTYAMKEYTIDDAMIIKINLGLIGLITVLSSNLKTIEYLGVATAYIVTSVYSKYYMDSYSAIFSCFGIGLLTALSIGQTVRAVDRCLVENEELFGVSRDRTNFTHTHSSDDKKTIIVRAILFLVLLYNDRFGIILLTVMFSCTVHRFLQKYVDITPYLVVGSIGYAVEYYTQCLQASVLVWFLYLLYIIFLTIYVSREGLMMKTRRVYCCGVFDLMHTGHHILLKNVSVYGDVVVGVVNDNDVSTYKRVPVMSHEERIKVVQNAKYVTEVIPNAPLNTTSAFMREHDIDLVAIGEEYYYPPYTYYEDCVAEKKYVIVPRYNDISTSDIIKRIKHRTDL